MTRKRGRSDEGPRTINVSNGLESKCDGGSPGNAFNNISEKDTSNRKVK